MNRQAHPGHGFFLEIAGGFYGEDGADIMDPLEHHGDSHPMHNARKT